MAQSSKQITDERTLLSRARKFDMDALSQIHDQQYAAVYRYISFKISDPHVVEDLSNEVFTRLLQAFKKKKGPDKSIRAWLLGTASNLVNDYFRAAYRVDEVEMDEHISSSADAPDQLVEQNMQNSALKEAMKRLTEEQQSVLGLRFGGGFSIKQVASQLNKTEGAVKMLQARAISTLSEWLKGPGEGSHGF